MDLSAALSRATQARKSLMLADRSLSGLVRRAKQAVAGLRTLPVKDPTKKDDAPGNLTEEAFVHGGALPPGVGRRRRAKPTLTVDTTVKATPVDVCPKCSAKMVSSSAPGATLWKCPACGAEYKDVAATPAAFTGEAPPDGQTSLALSPVPVTVEIDSIPEPMTIVFQGLPILIDRPAGFTQVKLADDGKVAWSRTYTTNYGYLPGTAGGDADELDCFVGPDTSSEEVWWFMVLDCAGAFDEYKLVFGAIGYESARAVIQAHIPPQFVAPGAAYTTIGQVKALLGQDPMARETALLAVSKSLDGAERMQKALKSVNAFMSKAPLQEMIEAPASFDHPAVTMPLSGTYPDPAAVGGWLGWIEPEDTSSTPRPPSVDLGAGRYSPNGFGGWIAFVGVDGRTLLWTERDADGGVIGAPYVLARPDLVAGPLTKAQKALRSVLKMGPKYEGALPLPADLATHPATIAQPTETYSNPSEVGGWLYVIDGGPWICFVGVDGKALLWTERDADGGVVGVPYEFRRDDLVAGVGADGRFPLMGMTSKSIDFKLVQVGKAAAPEEQYIFGVVLQPEIPDLQSEIYSAEVIRASAHAWLGFYRNFDVQHKVFINDKVDVAESYCAPLDFAVMADGETYKPDVAPQGAQMVVKGSWVLGAYVRDSELWAAIKRGEFTGWSINGLSRKEPA